MKSQSTSYHLSRSLSVMHSPPSLISHSFFTFTPNHSYNGSKAVLLFLPGLSLNRKPSAATGSQYRGPIWLAILQNHRAEPASAGTKIRNQIIYIQFDLPHSPVCVWVCERALHTAFLLLSIILSCRQGWGVVRFGGGLDMLPLCCFGPLCMWWNF